MTVLHLLTMRDRLPFRIAAQYIVALRPQAYIEDNDDCSQGTR